MTRGVAIVLAAAFFISLTNVLAPQVYDNGSNPLTYLTVRFLFFVAVCRIWFWMRGLSAALPKRQRLTAYAVGAVYSLGSGSFLGAIAYIPVSLAVLILYLYPLLTMITTCVLDRRKPRAIEVICLLVALIGLALAFEPTFTNLDPRGLALAALAAVAITCFVVWNGRSLSGLNSTIATFHTSVGALAVAAVATLATGSFTLEISGGYNWLIFALAVLSFTIGYFAIFNGVRITGPVRFATLMNMEPIITLGLSFILLGENLNLPQLSGAALVIGAVAVAQRPIQKC